MRILFLLTYSVTGIQIKHMSITVLGDKINAHMKRRYDGLGGRMCNQGHLRKEISAEMAE